MLTRNLQAVAFLLARIGHRDLMTPVTETDWAAGFPAGWSPEAVIADCATAQLIERLPSKGCARCDRRPDQHDNADHEPMPQAAAVRLRPDRLAAEVTARLRTVLDLQIGDPVRYADPSFTARGLYQEAQFDILLHLGLDRPALPPNADAGLPFLVADFRGAPPLPNPPAATFPWVNLLEEEALRDDAIAHLARTVDPSFLELHSIGRDLKAPQEPRDALAAFLVSCGFEDLHHEPPSAFADRARLSNKITRYFGRDNGAELIVECECSARLGWHLHGYRKGRRCLPTVLEPRLRRFVDRAVRTASTLRSLSARQDRLVENGAEVTKDLAAVGTGIVTFAGMVMGGDVAQALHNIVSTETIKAVAVAGGAAGTVWIGAPRLVKAWIALRLLFVRWPNRA